jgi:hypothetical protein
MVWVFGFVVVDVIAALAVFAWRQRGSVTAPSGPPPADLPDWVPSMAPSPINLLPGAGGMPDLNAIIANVQAAAADGQLTNDELQAMFPGAQVVRSGDGATVAHVASAQSIQVATAAGMQQYDSIDEIPDPAVREQLRQLMGGSLPGAAIPPPPPVPLPPPPPPPPPA